MKFSFIFFFVFSENIDGFPVLLLNKAYKECAKAVLLKKEAENQELDFSEIFGECNSMMKNIFSPKKTENSKPIESKNSTGALENTILGTLGQRVIASLGEPNWMKLEN
ncbi:Oidioi.mRNA.OKI2018_I69.PAR.g9926.t1.cds [Oikopleura dioica]|uniref:Oidioi.mRNA.OKI2018_I69.PAR.g9926.t1.cds n=1 Tax=Oikopleura dioica TaxID=34765 RepID=A0ABN7RMZ3_OIKDI|nr:Oidioi.mRNA.OKI2018_I69.PAR.g9926.t1.cds [Oikopleura dioica]